jgi:hypothetical protein
MRVEGKGGGRCGQALKSPPPKEPIGIEDAPTHNKNIPGSNPLLANLIAGNSRTPTDCSKYARTRGVPEECGGVQLCENPGGEPEWFEQAQQGVIFDVTSY